MDLSKLAEHKREKAVEAAKLSAAEVTDFKTGKLDRKKLRGHACDPDQAILVTIYSKRTQKVRRQLLKRFRLIGRLCFYQAENGQRYIGKIIAFFLDTGVPVIYAKEDERPDPKDPKMVLIET